MQELDKGLTAVEGVKADGVKGKDYGLTVIQGKGPSAAVFTGNKVKSAAIKVSKQKISNGHLDGVIANSGNANAFNGKQGLKDAKWMSNLPGKNKNFAVASTGIIGEKIERNKVEKLFQQINPSSNREASRKAAEAIMTTDTYPKEATAKTDQFTVAGVAKGSGMIEPNMGTMLAFLYTDADTNRETLQPILQTAVNQSFNRIVIDGENSTNDTVTLTATRKKQKPGKQKLQKAATKVCKNLAKQIARDGEGSTKLLKCTAKNVKTVKNGEKAAKTVLRSPLVKTAFYGENPNFGRIPAALGHSNIPINEKKLKIQLTTQKNQLKIAENGQILDFNPKKAKKILQNQEIHIKIDLQNGNKKATAYGCDLSPKYVKINAEYS